MRVALVLVLAAFVGLVGCKKDGGSSGKTATTSTGTIGADGTRRIEIEAGKEGYVPERIPGKPGEKLTLVFKRTVEGECLAQLKTPEGKLVELPMNKPVEVPVTVPATGDVKFACGMDMFTGVVVAEAEKT